MRSGIWDFGSLRCDGPTCTDPGRPAGGFQNSTSYEESGLATFACNKSGYVLSDAAALMCLRQTDCSSIQPITLVPSALKATSEMPGWLRTNAGLITADGRIVAPSFKQSNSVSGHAKTSSRPFV